MRQIETDYLVVGAGASGMAFTDALIASSDAEVLMVDRRDRPGGHWNDAYPFVRLHMPSAYYGVESRRLGEDRIDETGPNAGFYERATAAEVCNYFDRVMDEVLLASGRVRFLGMHDYAGNGWGEHGLVSRVTGETTTVRVRRKLVDATYMETTIPSRHTPSFTVDPDVRFVAPNDLVDLTDPGSGFTVIGAGKTAMDTCCWLVEHGVAPGSIRWIRPRDAWTFDRAAMQPLELVGSLVNVFAVWTEAAAEAEDPGDFIRSLEGRGGLFRLDPDVEPEVFRGAILSEAERSTLGGIENVVRLGRVRHVGTEEIELERGSIPSDGGQVHVDCSASGLGLPPARPIFEPDRISPQRIQFGPDPFSLALTGYAEATRADDGEKNRLCPPNPLNGEATDLARAFLVTQKARMAWMGEPDLAQRVDNTRLSLLRGMAEHLADPAAQAALMGIMEKTVPAIENLERIVSGATSPAAAR